MARVKGNKMRPQDPPLYVQDRLLDELLHRLRPEALDECENQRVRAVIENITCPATVRDREHFNDVVCEYYDGYYGGHCRHLHTDKIFRLMARQHFGSHLHGYPVPHRPTIGCTLRTLHSFPDLHPDAYSPAMLAAETHAISGNEGGMIGAVGYYERNLLTSTVESKVSLELSKVVPWEEYPDRWWLVTRIFTRFGHLLGNPQEHEALSWLHEETAFLYRFVLDRRALHRTMQH